MFPQRRCLGSLGAAAGIFDRKAHQHALGEWRPDSDADPGRPQRRTGPFIGGGEEIVVASRLMENVDFKVAGDRPRHFVRRQIEAVESSEERRVGEECVSKCKSRWWPYN